MLTLFRKRSAFMRALSLVLGGAVLATPHALTAQAAASSSAFHVMPIQPDLVSPAAQPAPREASNIRWYHVLGTAGGIAALSLLDRTVQRTNQNHRTSGKDDVAEIFRHAGQPEVYLPVALGTMAVGLVSGDNRILRSGGRIAGSLAVSGAFANFFKLTVGRTRPSYTTDPYKFRPFSRAASWPSGHTATAFSLASSVSDEVGILPVSIAAYGVASLTAWSRVNDNRHWLSDVAAGAVIGIASTKVINGRWRILGIGGPRFLIDSDHVGLSMAMPRLH